MSIISISLCSCSKTVVQNTNDSLNKNNEGTIEFTDVVLIDDELVKIELVNFFEKNVNWSTGKQNEKCITFKATNKTNYELSIHTDKFYLKDEEAFVCMMDGTMCPAPGKSGKYSFYIGKQGTPEHSALESLEELYDLEGMFEIYSKEKKSYKMDFSIENAINQDEKNQMQKMSEQKIYNISETVSTDIAEFSISRSEFGNKVAFGTEETFYRPTTENRGFSAGENKTFFIFTFNIKNISSKRISESDICGGNTGHNFTILYDSNYEFAEGYYADSDLLKDSSLAYIDPLETREMRGLIKCSSEIVDSQGKDVYLDVVLPSSNGKTSFRYVIK